MSIQCLYRVQCQPCERYLSEPGWVSAPYATGSTTNAALFLDFSSAYAEAVRRGWSAFPLICPDCAADLALRTESADPRKKKVRDGEVRDGGTPPEDGGGVPEGGQGPE